MLKRAIRLTLIAVAGLTFASCDRGPIGQPCLCNDQTGSVCC